MMPKDDIIMMSRNDYRDGRRMREVIVIGAGTTGAAAAYHLAEHGVRDILVLDMGRAGMGSPTSGLVPAPGPPPPPSTTAWARSYSPPGVRRGGNRTTSRTIPDRPCSTGTADATATAATTGRAP